MCHETLTKMKTIRNSNTLGRCLISMTTTFSTPKIRICNLTKCYYTARSDLEVWLGNEIPKFLENKTDS